MDKSFYHQTDKLFLNLADQVMTLDEFCLEYKNIFSTKQSLDELHYLGEKIKRSIAHFVSLKKIRIAILSTSTTYLIENYLRSLLLSNNVHLEFYHCAFNQLYCDIYNLSSDLYPFNPDIVCILTDEQGLLDLAKDHSIEAIQNASEEFVNHLQAAIHYLSANIPALIITHTLSIPQNLYNSYIDYRSKQLLTLCFNQINQQLLKLACHLKNLTTLDISIYLQHKEFALRDERLALYAAMRWDTSLLFCFSKEIVKIALAKLGLTKKCLVVDLDNTLWGGIIGDDGIQGVKLGGSYDGEAFKQFQVALKKLKNQGILLAISSKNESSIALEMIKHHPEMVLELDDFVAMKANWLPKSENIQIIVHELNVGLDSVVFIDDNIAECTLVSGFLPDVSTLHLPKDPTLYISTLLEKGYFNKLEITHEDKVRTKDYHAEANRRSLLAKYDNYEKYLADLGITIRVFIANSIDLNRISQLTQRTNQFNLSNERFTISQLEEINRNSFVLGIESEDKFGSSGIIGAVIARRMNDCLEIINFVLSCRVFSRQIEHSIFRIMLNLAKNLHCKHVRCRYIPTKKNYLVKECLQSEKFFNVSDLIDEEIYQHNLNDIAELPNWINYNNEIGNLYEHTK